MGDRQVTSKELADVEDSWDSLYDENGDVINDNAVSELNQDHQVKCLTAQMSTSRISDVDNNDEDYCSETNPNDSGVVVEVYDFPSDFKTSDLIASISA